MTRPIVTSLLALALVGPALAATVSPSSLGGGAQADVLVLFQDEVRSSDLDLLREAGFDGGHVYDNVPAVWTVGPADAVADLERHPRVQNVEPNREVELALSSSTKAAGAQASPVSPGALEQFGLTGENVTVAVVDTGIDGTHPDLPYPEKVVANKKVVTPAVENLTGFRPDAFQMASYPNTDEEGHGTHVAGTACGTGAASDGKFAGVAPGCKLVGVDVFEGPSSLLSIIAFGLDWVVEHQDDYDIRVASNSWGGGGDYHPNGTIETLISAMDEAGILPVFAAGNSGPDDGTMSPYSKAPEALGVANYEDHTGHLAPSSSQGVPGDPFRSPDVAAPGTDIVAPRASGDGAAALGPYSTKTGTSMATPHVSGAAALLLEANASLAPSDLRAIVKDTADPDRVTVVEDGEERVAEHHEQGAGALDAFAAAAHLLEDGAVEGALPGDDPLETPVVSEDDVTVEGTREPVAPPAREGGFPLTGNPLLFHNLTVVGLNPTGFTSVGYAAAQGEEVILQTRGTVSGADGYPFDTATEARFKVTGPSGDVTLVDAPRPHESEGTTSSGASTYEVSARWAIPADAEPGTHTFALQARTGPLDDWITGPSAPVEVEATPAPAPLPVDPPLPVTPPDPPEASGPPPGSGVDNPLNEGAFTFPATSDTVFFEDDLETFDPAYETFNDGLAHGAATQWTYVGDAAPLVAPPHSGDHAYYVGVASSGAESGTGYTDFARAGLVLPAIDLSIADDATLSYWLSGSSEEGWDFLYVEAKRPSASSWTLEASHSGASFDWTRETVDLSEYAGGEVQVRFVFDSDFLFPFGFGWLVDDLRVVGAEVDNRAPLASLEVDESFGTSDVTFTVNATDPEGDLDSWTLDLGDGNEENGTSFPATVDHTYDDEAVHEATLTVNDTDGAEGTDSLEVNTVQSVQVNGGAGWVTATDTSSDGDWSTWEADLNLSTLADGPQELQVRYPDGAGGFHADVDAYVLAREPVVDPGETPLVAVGEDVTLDVDVVSPSGDHTTSWDLDGDGKYDDAQGDEVTHAFDAAGERSVGVQVVDSEDPSLVTNATVAANVYEVESVLTAADTFVKGAPEEAAWFIFFGYSPTFSVEHHAYEVNLTQVRENTTGSVVGLEAELGWTHEVTDEATSDLDLWVIDPNGNVSSQGATLSNPEHATFEDPPNGTHELYVEPFLVAQPTHYDLAVDVHVLPDGGG